MGYPVLQKMIPDRAVAGMRVDCFGHNMSNAEVRLDDGGSVTVITPETADENSLSFLLPIAAVVGWYSVSLTNVDGASQSFELYLTDDPMLGFPVCLEAKTVEDYRQQVTKMQPRGRVWNTNPASNWQKLIQAVLDEIVRVRGRGCELRNELIPAKTVNLLPEFEFEYGLPDECNAISAQTFEERRTELVRKFVATGGSTITYFRELLSYLGIDATIEDGTGVSQFLCGLSRCGDRLWGTIFLFTWYVTINDYEITYFKCGESRCGDRLRWWGADPIECLFEKLKPAHTNVVVRFGGEQADEIWYDVDDDLDEIIYDVDTPDEIVYDVY